MILRLRSPLLFMCMFLFLLLLALPAAARPRPVCNPPPNRVKVGEGILAASDDRSDVKWLAWLGSLGAEVDCYVWAAYDGVRAGHVPQAGWRIRDWLRAHDYRDAMIDSGPRSSWDGMRWGDTPHWGCFATASGWLAMGTPGRPRARR